MTLSEYVKGLAKLLREGHGDKTVITSSDDEGNSYSDVLYHPCLISIEDIEDVYQGEGKEKVVCIN